jgi:hypothetical protein
VGEAVSTLEGAMRMAAICGLATVREAVANAEHTASMFMEYSEIPAYLEKLHAEFDAWTGGMLIPANIITEENEKLAKYFAESGQTG